MALALSSCRPTCCSESTSRPSYLFYLTNLRYCLSVCEINLANTANMRRRPNVVDDGPTVNQRWAKISCLRCDAFCSATVSVN